MSKRTYTADERREQLEHARGVNDSIARTAERRRTAYAALVVAFLIAALVLLFFAEYVFGACLIGIAVVFGLLLLDAHGHLHEIRNRPVGTLAPHISDVLRPVATEPAPDRRP